MSTPAELSNKLLQANLDLLARTSMILQEASKQCLEYGLKPIMASAARGGGLAGIGRPATSEELLQHFQRDLDEGKALFERIGKVQAALASALVDWQREMAATYGKVGDNPILELMNDFAKQRARVTDASAKQAVVVK